MPDGVHLASSPVASSIIFLIFGMIFAPSRKKEGRIKHNEEHGGNVSLSAGTSRSTGTFSILHAYLNVTLRARTETLKGFIYTWYFCCIIVGKSTFRVRHVMGKPLMKRNNLGVVEAKTKAQNPTFWLCSEEQIQELGCTGWQTVERPMNDVGSVGSAWKHRKDCRKR